VDPRAGLDDVEKRKFLTLPVLEIRPLGLPARSQSLYRLQCKKSRIRDDGVMSRNMSYEMTNVWCSHTLYSGDRIK
jgi:hypothetical protein